MDKNLILVLSNFITRFLPLKTEIHFKRKIGLNPVFKGLPKLTIYDCCHSPKDSTIQQK